MSVRSFSVEWLEGNHVAVGGMSRIVVHREFVEHQEYGSVWKAVFLDDGRYWQVPYQEPNTSEVHVDTWFDDLDVSATEVKPVPKFITDWVPVGRPSGGWCGAHLIPEETEMKGNICSRDAPFLISVLNGHGVDSLERCIAHTHMLLTSAESFPQVQEVRRRWR